ncbi:MAG: hypothetical protein KDC98_16805, partial [Planctomycetes bacterium]|nr:hypothetical protein [Planctomycetota bacterium]
LPAPIRMLQEVTEPQNQLHSMSPLHRAEKEIRFFKDLWTMLFQTNSPWHGMPVPGAPGPGLTVNLLDLWVKGTVSGHIDQVYWYSDPNNAATLTWIDLPHEFPLIDFLWTESEVSRGFKLGDAVSGSTIEPLSSTEFVELIDLVQVLLDWDYTISPQPPETDRFYSRPTSAGACLLEMMRMGFNGQGETYGRHWVRQRGGQVPDSVSNWLTLQQPSGQPAGGTGTLIRRDVAWSHVGDVFSSLLTQHGSLFAGGLEPPYLALYDWTGAVRTTLGPGEINELVEFFLKLGGHYIDPDFNDHNPSRKMARWELAGQDTDKFMNRFVPAGYPLTGGLERLAVVRALLDTAAYLGEPIPQFRQHFGSRAYDHNNAPIWPGTNVDFVGAGLRAVVWNEDLTQGWVVNRGYQSRFLGMGGSYATLLALFPDQGGVESYFWCTPGVQPMGTGTSRFNVHMNAHAANTLLQSYFTDFATDPVSLIRHYYQ